MYTVAISTLHGKIISLPVEPDTIVSAFKQECLDACPGYAPLAVNADWAEVMVNSLDIWGEGVRIAHVDGPLLQDAQSIGSQVHLGHNLFLFKMCFMRQTHFNARENAMIADFADDSKSTSGYIVDGTHGTQFVVRPVWGCQNRAEEILGVLYQHRETERHCQLMERGVDPRQIDNDFPALSFDVVVPKATAAAKGRAKAKAKGKRR